MTHTSEKEWKEKVFSACAFEFWLPPISQEARTMLAASKLLSEWSHTIASDLNVFSSEYARRIYEGVRSWTVDETLSAVAWGDKVYMSPSQMLVLAQGKKWDTTVEFQSGKGPDALFENRFLYEQAQRRRDTRGLGSTISWLDSYKPEKRAIYFLSNTFSTQVESWLRLAQEGVHGVTTAEYIVSQARGFLTYCEEQGFRHIDIQAGWGRRHSYDPMSLLIGFEAAELLWKARAHGGKINGIPVKNFYIPWDILPNA